MSGLGIDRSGNAYRPLFFSVVFSYDANGARGRCDCTELACNGRCSVFGREHAEVMRPDVWRIAGVEGCTAHCSFPSKRQHF